MVVDDEPDIVSIIKKYLEMWGFSVDGFTDPIQALEQYRNDTSRYSLVMLDLAMPQINGFEFAQRLLAINPEVKLLIITAFYDVIGIPPLFMDTLSHEQVLQKPLKLQVVCQSVKKELNLA